MPFAEINWLAVLVASVVSLVIGFLWFSPKTFFPVWRKAMGRRGDEAPEGACRWERSSASPSSGSSLKPPSWPW
ncbi:MAG: hypothetical protein ACYC0W_08985 [Candidatus Nanopelagicales bacterium]